MNHEYISGEVKKMPLTTPLVINAPSGGFYAGAPAFRL